MYSIDKINIIFNIFQNIITDSKNLIEEKFGLRHSIKLSSGGLLKELSKVDEVMVNSLHGQGINRVADGFNAEAISPDGVIEAISMQGAESFTVGVQWHAEWGVESHSLSRKLFEAFGLAALTHAKISTEN